MIFLILLLDCSVWFIGTDCFFGLDLWRANLFGRYFTIYCYLHYHYYYYISIIPVAVVASYFYSLFAIYSYFTICYYYLFICIIITIVFVRSIVAIMLGLVKIFTKQVFSFLFLERGEGLLLLLSLLFLLILVWLLLSVILMLLLFSLHLAFALVTQTILII